MPLFLEEGAIPQEMVHSLDRHFTKVAFLGVACPHVVPRLVGDRGSHADAVQEVSLPRASLLHPLVAYNLVDPSEFPRNVPRAFCHLRPRCRRNLRLRGSFRSLKKRNIHFRLRSSSITCNQGEVHRFYIHCANRLSFAEGV